MAARAHRTGCVAPRTVRTHRRRSRRRCIRPCHRRSGRPRRRNAVRIAGRRNHAGTRAADAGARFHQSRRRRQVVGQLATTAGRSPPQLCNNIPTSARSTRMTSPLHMARRSLDRPALGPQRGRSRALTTSRSLCTLQRRIASVFCSTTRLLGHSAGERVRQRLLIQLRWTLRSERQSTIRSPRQPTGQAFALSACSTSAVGSGTRSVVERIGGLR